MTARHPGGPPRPRVIGTRREAERQGRPERARDELPLRIWDVDVLRLQAPVASVGSGSAATNVSGPSPGEAGTTYHFRLSRRATPASPRLRPVVHDRTLPDGRTGSLGASALRLPWRRRRHPERRPTSWFVEDPSTSYGSRTASRGGLRGPDRAVAASFRGSSRARLYHFRLVASNSVGTTRGPDATSRRRGAAVVTGPRHLRDPVAHLGAVTGHCQPHGLDASIWFEYGHTRGYGSPPTSRSPNGSPIRRSPPR